MPRVAADVPRIDSILCGHCGYTLDGLPPESNCPECGTPIIQSTIEDGRHPPAWESSSGLRLKGLLLTTLTIIFRPTHFFKSLPARDPLRPAMQFAFVQWFIAGALFSDAALKHAVWFAQSVGSGLIKGSRIEDEGRFTTWIVRIVLIGLIAEILLITTHIAAALSAWEARYRGMRLPGSTVLRALYYHGAHYLPVGLLAVVTTRGHALLLKYGKISEVSDYPYLIILSIEVVVSAAYLFWTYWIGMRNMMYANR